MEGNGGSLFWASLGGHHMQNDTFIVNYCCRGYIHELEQQWDINKVEALMYQPVNIV